MGDRVCVKVAAAETKTSGGILLPTDAQRKPTSGAQAESRPLRRGGGRPAPLLPARPRAAPRRGISLGAARLTQRRQATW